MPSPRCLLIAGLSHQPHLSLITAHNQPADIEAFCSLHHRESRLTTVLGLFQNTEPTIMVVLPALLASMTWAQRLKRVFSIEIETCHACGGSAKVIACIEDPVVIQKILDYLDQQEARQWTGRLPQGRAPPAGLFG